MDAETLNLVATMISTVGFPIVACCILFYMYDKTINKLTNTLDKMDKTLDKVFDKIESIENDLTK